jgi:hypothetical protein
MTPKEDLRHFKFTLHPFPDFERTASCLCDKALEISLFNAIIFGNAVLGDLFPDKTGSPHPGMERVKQYPYFHVWRRKDNLLALPNYLSALGAEYVTRALSRGLSPTNQVDVASEANKIMGFMSDIRELSVWRDHVDFLGGNYINHQKFLLWADWDYYSGMFPELMDEDLIPLSSTPENKPVPVADYAAATASGNLGKYIEAYARMQQMQDMPGLESMPDLTNMPSLESMPDLANMPSLESMPDLAKEDFKALTRKPGNL